MAPFKKQRLLWQIWVRTVWMTPTSRFPTWVFHWWMNVFGPEKQNMCFDHKRVSGVSWAEMMLTLTCTDSLSGLERAEPLWPPNLRGVLRAWLIFPSFLVNNLSHRRRRFTSLLQRIRPPFVVVWGGLYVFIGSPSNRVTTTVGGEMENWAGPGLGCKNVQVMTVTNAVLGISERQSQGLASGY